MNQQRRNLTPIQVLGTVIQFGIVGLIDALPLALAASLFFGGQVGRDMWLLGAVLVGSWLPVLNLFQMILQKNPKMTYIPAHSNLRLLIMSAIPFVFMAPILWVATFSSLLLGIAVYVLTDQTLLLALLAALVYQGFNLYRQSQVENAVPMAFTFNVQDMGSVMNQNPFSTSFVQEDDSTRLRSSDDDSDADVIILDTDSFHKKEE